MEILTDPKLLQERCFSWRCKSLSIALVPTMGSFHDGHFSLMDYGRAEADKLIVSLFVNPTQFGPQEDLDAYPRNFERDAQAAREHGVDLLFAPRPEAMYHPDHATWVEVPDLARNLCGKSRPIHFRGVATVVAKLFILAQPTLAVFGEKDFQQLAILRRMVRDLGLPVEVVGRPTVREADGLAMSSRNVYLEAEERSSAPAIRQGLKAAREWVAEGERSAAEIKRRLELFWADRLSKGRIDYVEVVDPESMAPLETIADRALVAAAVRIGSTRLIDNILITV
ncbi:MAG: pantoate--beta-alanine ligase [Desulfovibrionales bacterium]|nr:pantoate--beta-alanine ligase [Desulfovibrionales bacterium]